MGRSEVITHSLPLANLENYHTVLVYAFRGCFSTAAYCLQLKEYTRVSGGNSIMGRSGKGGTMQ